mmetsp:Transcript_12513/g.38623  ORF Transcript_12513/g.38623 Transcript_12513/m.38623 type:complete len:94 (+) Transcript_12513:330-611(+)
MSSDSGFAPSEVGLVVAALFVSLGLGGMGVAWLENSEWRQNLRRRCAEIEAAQGKGVTQEDMKAAAINMGLIPSTCAVPPEAAGAGGGDKKTQ